MGGLVTCAKGLLEIVVERLGRLDSTASGVSLPIEPVASSPPIAMGVRMNLMSSWL